MSVSAWAAIIYHMPYLMDASLSQEVLDHETYILRHEWISECECMSGHYLSHD